MFLTEPLEIDAELHFAAAIIANTEADERVHVTEPGPYLDFVFMNLQLKPNP